MQWPAPHGQRSRTSSSGSAHSPGRTRCIPSVGISRRLGPRPLLHQFPERVELAAQVRAHDSDLLDDRMLAQVLEELFDLLPPERQEVARIGQWIAEGTGRLARVAERLLLGGWWFATPRPGAKMIPDQPDALVLRTIDVRD